MFDLMGKTAVVTGAGSGIGEAIAHALAGAGAYVYVFDRDAAAGARVAGEIIARTGKPSAEAVAADVSDEASVNAACGRVLAERGACDILVNNAGIGHVGTLLTTTAADLDKLYAVNVKGVLLMTRGLLPAMVGRGRGSVINMASVAGVVAVKDRFAYTTTKFAVVGMTKAMAADHAHTLVRFNAICPGRVETPFVAARIKEYPDPEKAYREMSATQLVNRMGRPEEIAALALYLAADESSFVTGSAVLIDGGMSAV